MKTKDLKNGTSEILRKSIKLLPKSDGRKYTFVVLIQVLLGFLDLIGVVILGLIGSLAVRGLSFQEPGDRVGGFLKLLNLENTNLRLQLSTLGLIATLMLISKSVASLYIGRKTLFFLSRRSAYLSTNLVSRLFTKDLSSIQKESLL